jgi:hypothetical protein
MARQGQQFPRICTNCVPLVPFGAVCSVLMQSMGARASCSHIRPSFTIASRGSAPGRAAPSRRSIVGQDLSFVYVPPNRQQVGRAGAGGGERRLCAEFSVLRRDRAVVARAGALSDLPAGRLCPTRGPASMLEMVRMAMAGFLLAVVLSHIVLGLRDRGPALAQAVGRGLRHAVLPQFRASLAASVRGDLLADLGGQDHRDDRAALAVLARDQLSILTRMVATLRPRMEAAGG